ncbi:acyltransferase family protein [Terrihalobacillus insolitus]|uniref:acyltransferase family protein n=1 Tax=Terrihalobacillus insolitus TaxID=2950438 RepID=UPI0023426117|nr:acyltransferase family protein [Terrihalobacillus insolitus]MDC3414595.1 acyltransferase family protein [Terrihalobacillus insolitus]
MQRDAYMDNARLALIFLVVFGHVIQPMVSESKAIETLYLWIYFFHMPAFIFLAGFFAKGLGNFTYIAKLAKKLLYPYLFFQLFYTAYFFFIDKNDWYNTLFYPQWALWFLLSLFCWHILLLLYKRISPLIGIMTAILVGIFIGYMSDIGHMFSLSRTFVFFPFFLIGYWVKKEHLALLKTKAVRLTGIGILLLAAIGLAISPSFSVGWLLESKSYATLNMPVYGGFIRLGVYILGFAMSVSVFAFIPKKQFRWTSLGQRTLYVYLLHGIFIWLFRTTDLIQVDNLLDLLGAGVVSLTIVFVLSNKWVVGIWQPVVEGKLTFWKELLKRNKKVNSAMNDRMNKKGTNTFPQKTGSTVNHNYYTR